MDNRTMATRLNGGMLAVATITWLVLAAFGCAEAGAGGDSPPVSGASSEDAPTQGTAEQAIIDIRDQGDCRRAVDKFNHALPDRGHLNPKGTGGGRAINPLCRRDGADGCGGTQKRDRHFKRWHLNVGPNQTVPVFDGLGRPIARTDGFQSRPGDGVSNKPWVYVNWGQRKRIAGRAYVLAWAVQANQFLAVDGSGYTDSQGAGRGHVTGWIRTSDFIPKERGYLNGHHRNAMPAIHLPRTNRDYDTERTLTGGAAGVRQRLAKFRVGVNGYGIAEHYMLRPGDLVGLYYNIPGCGYGGFPVDAFRVDPRQPKRITFTRSKGTVARRVRLHGPNGGSDAFTFIYGYVTYDGGKRRYGWIPEKSLKRGAPLGSPARAGSASGSSGSSGGGTSGGAAGGGQNGGGGAGGGQGGGGGGAAAQPQECHVRCCRPGVHRVVQQSSQQACSQYASNLCGGQTLRARYPDGQSLIYEAPSHCWAKCKNRQRYHSLGIPQGCKYGQKNCCRKAVKLWCYVNDRGGFEDADWNRCSPDYRRN